MTTTIVNRALLRMRRIELEAEDEECYESGRTSPFSAGSGVLIVDMDAPADRSNRWLELNKLSSKT
jgi:hypothetical protein